MAETATVAESTVATPDAAAQATTEPATIATHEAQYGRNGSGPAVEDDDSPLDDVVDETPQTRGRGSRAKSKMAAARINKLSTRIFELEQQLAAREVKEKPAADEPKPVFDLPDAPKFVDVGAAPTLEQFADKDDPYGEWLLAKMKYDLKREQAQADAGKQHEAFQQTAKEAQAYWAGVQKAHVERVQALVAKNPAAAATLQSVTMQIPPLLDRSIMLDENSADVALYLASHPEELDDFVLRTAAQPVTEQTVAITRRLLRQRMTAGTTGSVAPSKPTTPAPIPPNPVRTGPMRTTDSPPGDDSMSLAAHERHFGKGKHR